MSMGIFPVAVLICNALKKEASRKKKTKRDTSGHAVRRGGELKVREKGKRDGTL